MAEKPGRKTLRKTRVSRGQKESVRATPNAGGEESVSNVTTRKKSGRRKAVAQLIEQPRIRRPDIHPLDRAIAELRAELSKSPDDPTILGRLGALHYRRGDLNEAENFYRRAISFAPGRPSLYNNLGNVLCDMGRMRDGIAAYEHAMEIEKANDPTHAPSPEAVTNLELAKMEYRLIHERVEYFERAAQLEVTSAEAYNALGCGYLLRGQRTKALETFRLAATADPRNVYAALNIAFSHSLDLSGRNDPSEAAADIAEAIVRFPHEARLHIHQGELHENSGLFENAEESYLRALDADPHCLEAYDLLGRLREATGFAHARDDGARKVERVLQALDRNAREQRAKAGDASGGAPLYDMAFVEIARAKFTRKPLAHSSAVDGLLREACAAGPGNITVQAAILRAAMLETDGRRDEARVIIESALKTESRSARLWMEWGTMTLRSGTVDMAVEAFEQATIHSPQDAVSYHSLRFAFEGLRRYRTERVRFETASRANPRDALAHHHLALAALSVLKDEEALFHFTRALELDPRLSDAACGRGRALERQGHFDEAQSAYEKALDIDPENGEAQRALIAIRSRSLITGVCASLFTIPKHGRGRGRLDENK
jgi:tetratricopeptide (TPR) repeat protein